jgi:hypothetical protein
LREVSLSDGVGRFLYPVNCIEGQVSDKVEMWEESKNKSFGQCSMLCVTGLHAREVCISMSSKVDVKMLWKSNGSDMEVGWTSMSKCARNPLQKR